MPAQAETLGAESPSLRCRHYRVETLRVIQSAAQCLSY